MTKTTSTSECNCQDCAISTLCVLGRLADAERALLAPQVRPRILHRGDHLMEEGQTARFVRVIKLGTAFAYRRGLDGHSRPIGVMARGSAFGLPGVFEARNQISGIALTTTRVCELPAATLRDIGRCGSKLLAQLVNAIMDNVAAMAAWSEVMRVPGTINQLAYIVVLLAEASKSSMVELPSHAALAELLGTRRETIARGLRTLVGEGGIRRHERRRCEVFSGRLLERLAQSAG
jgi:CRP/FNR family transcriptional regulator